MVERVHHGKEFSFKNYLVPFTTIKAIHWIIIIGLVVYCNGLINGFIGDDETQIIYNLQVHSITNIFILFSGGTFFNGATQLAFGSYYKPLMLVFYSGIYTIFGPNYFMFHLIQLSLHLCNAVFLFLVLNHFFKRKIAFVLSIIFLIHPINSEAVYYIADMQDVLFFFFGILSLWIVQNYNSQRSLIIASICLLLSLLSKETGILFFCLVPAYFFLFKVKRILFLVISEILVFLLYLVLRIHAIGIFSQVSTSSLIANYPLPVRLENIPAMFLFYLKTFIYPKDLAISYQWVYTTINISNFWFPLVIDLLFLIVIFCNGFILYKKYSRRYIKLYLFFVFWFLLGILFHMQLIPLDATVADRWFYFPIVGLLGLVGVSIEAFRVNLRNKWIIVTIAIIIALLSIRTFERSFDWRDEITLGTHDLKVSSDAWGIENMLATAYSREGKYKIAKIYLDRSIKIYPQMLNYGNLGILDVDMGDYKDGKVAYLKSIQLGDYFQSYESLAFLDTVYGNPQENIKYIQDTALKKFPYDATLWLCLAILEYNQGNKDIAKSAITQAYKYSQSSQTIAVYNAVFNGKLKKINVHL
jgi:tetratricopeptide (TPR) repeat protein